MKNNTKTFSFKTLIMIKGSSYQMIQGTTPYAMHSLFSLYIRSSYSSARANIFCCLLCYSYRCCCVVVVQYTTLFSLRMFEQQKNTTRSPTTKRSTRNALSTSNPHTIRSVSLFTATTFSIQIYKICNL